MKRNYVEESVHINLEENSLVLGTVRKVLGVKIIVKPDLGQIMQFITDLTYSLDMYGEAMGYDHIPNPLETELKGLKLKHKTEISLLEDQRVREFRELHEEIRSLSIQLRNALEER